MKEEARKLLLCEDAVEVCYYNHLPHYHMAVKNPIHGCELWLIIIDRKIQFPRSYEADKPQFFFLCYTSQ